MYFIKRIKDLLKYYMSFFLNSKFKEFQSFPFDPNKKMPDGAENIMKQCSEILSKLDITYRISDGTILGIYRSGEFIPHDNDIDVEIIGDEYITQIESEFKKLGMKLGRKAIYKNKVHQIVYYTADNIIFDIVIWHKNSEDNKLYNYSERNYERVQDSKYFIKENMEYIEFKGNSYPIPTPIEEWLEMRYGKDWKIPKTYKGDWKEECFDMKRMD